MNNNRQMTKKELFSLFKKDQRIKNEDLLILRFILLAIIKNSNEKRFTDINTIVKWNAIYRFGIPRKKIIRVITAPEAGGLFALSYHDESQKKIKAIRLY